MLELNLRLDSESDFMLFEPNEREDDLDKQSAIIDSVLADKKMTWLVAVDDEERLQGFCVISRKPLKRVCHIGCLVIGVARSIQAKGVGFELITKALELSEKKGVTRVELTVRSDNVRAISLYKKAGFVQEGVRQNSLLISGRLYSELYMAKV